MKGHQSLGDLLKAGEYAWVDSLKRSRSSNPPSDDAVGFDEERHPLRTVIFSILLSGLAGLLAYCSYLVASRGGRNIFLFSATLGVFLACGALASRRRMLLRLVLLLGSLCTFAVLIDQVVYYRWHKQVDRLVTTLRQGIESGSPALPDAMNVRPTSFRIGPDREVLLTFEPPLLAWTYHLGSASSLGRNLVANWYGILSKATRGRRLSGVARTIVQPHEIYSIGVKSEEKTLVCQEGNAGSLSVSIDRRLGALSP